MANFKIKGGKKLSGTIEISASKNAALAILSASLMTDEPTTLHNVPRIEEVNRFEEIFTSIGVKFDWTGENSLVITPPKNLALDAINHDAAARTRSIIYFMGALMHSHDEFKIPKSGGCDLGKRTVKPHLGALQHFGVDVESTNNHYEVSVSRNTSDRYIVMSERGDTPTNNAIMGAVLSSGTTTIKNASANYMVQDLCHFLNGMGAKISGIGTTVLKIEGVEKLHGSEYRIMNDPIVAMFWYALAATTQSDLIVVGAPRDFVELELTKMEEMGMQFEILKNYTCDQDRFDLIDVRFTPSTLKATGETISPMPFPGLNIDNLPFFVVIAAAAEGNTLIHDWCYDGRTQHMAMLNQLGVKNTFMDGHRLMVHGPAQWSAGEVVCPPALRPATLFVIAALAANGTSIIRNTYPIDRGYENLYEALKSVGADIEEVV